MAKKNTISTKNIRAVRRETKAFLKQVNKLQEASPSTGSSEDTGWRPITGKKVDRDLSPVTQDKMQNIAVWLYDSDPIAKRIIDLKRDFLVGDGVIVKAEDKEVDGLLQDFWYDPINNMDLFIPDIARDLGMLGEQAIPAFVNRENGHVRLGYIDPCQIESVVTNPDNCRELVGMVLKDMPDYMDMFESDDIKLIKRWRKEQGKPAAELSGKPKRSYTIINIGQDANNTDTFERMTGETFFFAINKVTNATRGRSDLLSLADWIHNYETFLFNRIERARLLNSFTWDVELQNMSQPEIEKWLKTQSAPRPSSIRAHNDKVKWTTVEPKLESNDASNEANMFRAHIAGGAGIPVHWLGGGEGLTRATALEMSTPVFKHLKQRQLYLKYIVTSMIDFVIDQAIIAGRLKENVNRDFAVKFPPLSQKDLVSLSTVLQGMSTALVLAKDAKFITPEEASKHMRFALNLLGGDLNPEPIDGVDVNPSSSGQEPDEGVGVPDALGAGAGNLNADGVQEAADAIRKVKKKWGRNG
jgi:hypothetical protein